MFTKKIKLILVFSIAIITISSAQTNYRIQNGIGIYGGLTNFNINTDNFVTESGNGWLAGLAATVNLPHRWYNVSYNIQLSENQIGFSAAPLTNGTTEFVNHKVFAAQVALIGHLKIIENYLTLDAGPMLQFNGTLDLQDDNKENYILEGYDNLTVSDIENISRFNVNGAIGATAGFDQFKIRAQYIYGFTNMLNALNKENLPEGNDFKGNQNMLVFSAMFIF